MEYSEARAKLLEAAKNFNQAAFKQLAEQWGSAGLPLTAIRVHKNVYYEAVVEQDGLAVVCAYSYDAFYDGAWRQVHELEEFADNNESDAGDRIIYLAALVFAADGCYTWLNE